MGYRHYFYSIPKTEIEEIKRCKSIDDFCKFCIAHNYEVVDYGEGDSFVPVYNLGKEIYEFGKDVDWAFNLQEKNESIFGNAELKQQYDDYCPVVCTQEDFLFVIDEYKKKIINYYKKLLQEDGTHKLTNEQRWKWHLENQLWEWENEFGFSAVNTDLSKSFITNSWLYEYSIFELVRQYKTFDFENNALVLIGR